jgi:hypothetical protein
MPVTNSKFKEKRQPKKIEIVEKVKFNNGKPKKSKIHENSIITWQHRFNKEF